MKLRQGFVSNSSTSSFVVTMGSLTYRNIIASLGRFAQTVFDKFDENGGIQASDINGK